MAHTHASRLALTVLSSLLLGAVALGCASKVVSEPGTGGEGGSGGTIAGGGGDCPPADIGGPCTEGATQACVLGGGGGGGGSPGIATCTTVADCTNGWGPCEPIPETSTSVGTPLVLSFDGAPVEYVADRTHTFDINGSRSLVTDWPTARTPWLALDRDGNGRIDDGTELFGSMSVLEGGDRAPNGFVALRELDADGDGRITPADPGFSRLLVWSDHDGDRLSTGGELASAEAWELLSIDLGYTVDRRCDARGNCEVERASFRYRDGTGVERTGAIVDVHFAAQR